MTTVAIRRRSGPFPASADLGADEHVGKGPAASVQQGPQPAQCEGERVENMGQVPQRQPAQRRRAPSRLTTSMPMTERPRLHPVLTGRSHRLTAMATTTAAATARQTHHSQLPRGADHPISSDVTARASGQSTSIPNAAARAHHPYRSAGIVSLVVVGGGVRRARRARPSLAHRFDVVDFEGSAVRDHPDPQPVAQFLVDLLVVRHGDPGGDQDVD